MMNKTLQPSPALYAQVRAGFVKQGTSLNQWCIAHSLHRQSARKLLLGEWKGPTATRLLAAIIEASQHE